MSDIKFLIPNPGVQVRDPLTFAPLKPEGEYKPMIRYWRGVVRDGDVQMLDDAPVQKTVNTEETE